VADEAERGRERDGASTSTTEPTAAISVNRRCHQLRDPQAVVRTDVPRDSPFVAWPQRLPTSESRRERKRSWSVRPGAS
jgi:hypothetical protein